MSATGTITQVVFWGHVLGAAVLGVTAVAVRRLVAELSFAPGGIEGAPWTRASLKRGMPTAVGLFAVAVVGYGFAHLADAVRAADPAVSVLSVVEQVSLVVPGAAIGRWGAIAGLVVFNAAVVVSVLDLGYRWATAR